MVFLPRSGHTPGDSGQASAPARALTTGSSTSGNPRVHRHWGAVCYVTWPMVNDAAVLRDGSAKLDKGSQVLMQTLIITIMRPFSVKAGG